MSRVFPAVLIAAVVAVCSIAATAQQPHWLDVPFVSQPDNGCGAAVISMTLQYWAAHGAKVAEKDFNVNAIQDQLYSASDHGIRASDLIHYFVERGFRAFPLSADMHDLDEHIARGSPLILALRESKSVLHYVVLVGTDPSQRWVLVNDPAQRKLLKMDANDFRRAWAGTQNWTLLVVPQS